MVGKVALLPPEHAVLKVYNLIRHIQPHSMRARLCSDIKRRRSRRTTRSCIYYAAVALVRRLSGHNIGSAACARISESRAAKALQGGGVEFGAQALGIRRCRAVIGKAALVPVKAEPMQVVLYKACIFTPGSLRVKVLYAQNPTATGIAHGKPRHKCREHIAEMHAPGGRRGETSRLHAFSFFKH